MKKVVVIGGGTGLSILLRGLKLFPIDITAVVTVADDGSSTGVLRNEFNIPAVGDLRNVLVSLSEVEPLVEKLFQYRFETDSDLNHHALGNLLLTALYNITGSLTESLKALSKILNIKGRILPFTEDSPYLVGYMKDGSVVKGEDNITKAGKVIDHIEYQEEVKVIPEVIRAINEADLVIFGIGSLYTSIIPNVLNDEVRKVLINSKAKKMYICNAMTQHGETDGYKVSDCVRAINKHVGKDIIDVVLANTKYVDVDIQKLYMEEKATPIVIDEENLKGIEVIKEELVNITNKQVRHNYIKTALCVFTYLMRDSE